MLGLASRAWAQASLAGPAAQALRKLQRRRRRARRRLADRDRAAAAHRRAGVRAGQDRRASTAVRSASPTAPPARPRSPSGTSQPWGIASWHGRWYLTGFDTDRGRARASSGCQPDRGRRAPGTAGRVVRRAGRPRAARHDQPRWWPSVTCSRRCCGCAPAPGTRLRRRARTRRRDRRRLVAAGRGLRRHRGVRRRDRRLRPRRRWSSSRCSCARPWSAGSEGALAAHQEATR